MGKRAVNSHQPPAIRRQTPDARRQTPDARRQTPGARHQNTRVLGHRSPVDSFE